MAGERLTRVLDLLASDDEQCAGRLCDVAAATTAMSGAGVLLLADGLPRGSLSSSNAESALIDDLEFTLGEGPSIDAYREDQTGPRA